ncbi:photosystem reaction center protein H [Paracoccus siganidrum]|uniref:Photosystem reaction center protein H n=1 Tax=Paracoccus siganidrum TaxID=1276757 RepID=A0A419AC16_9RHOB|nr:photosystem reaction center protein H [Paracoccus siganidrum]RJL21525.1 photosystem reaction center protein H [Paracoccus siganidrum]RMC30938.1 photosystem reaction center protein H [Paracoccus siganidrum]
MRKLLATSALAASLLCLPAHAQTESEEAPDATATQTDARLTITPPEGFAEENVVLSTDNLEGATVHDADGDEIGEVHGLVFSNGSSSIGGANGDGAAATPPDDAAAETEGAADDAAGSAGQIDETTTQAGAAQGTVGDPGPVDQMPLESAEITHAIIDVGGFLGLGEHRVAIPVADLVVFTNEDELRIYLPWTQEQLEALPEFDEDDPDTTGG